MEKIAPWQPADDAVLMATEPGRATVTVPPAAIAVDRPVWLVKVTPVVVQELCPLSAVMVPLAVTLIRVTAKEFGLVIFTMASPEPPGSSGVVGAVVAETRVTACKVPVLARPAALPELVK